jgi:cytochrome c2
MKHLLVCLCLLAITGVAQAEEGISQAQKDKYAGRFSNDLFSKCNACHKPFEDNKTAEGLVAPSYWAMNGMRPGDLKHAIKHNGHLSKHARRKIYTIITMLPRLQKKDGAQ